MAVSETNSGLKVRGNWTCPDVGHNSETASSSFLDSNEYVDMHNYEDISKILHESPMARPKSALFQDSRLQTTPTESRKEGWSSHTDHSTGGIASAYKSRSPMAMKCSEPSIKEESKDHALEDAKPKLSWKPKDTQAVGVHLLQKVYHSLSTRRTKTLPVKQKQRPVITVIVNKERTCGSDLRMVHKEQAIKQKLRESDLHSDKEHHAGFPSHGQKQAMSVKPSKEVLRKQYKHRPPPMTPPSACNKEKYCSNFELVYSSSSEVTHLSRPKFHDQRAQSPTKITHSIPKEDTHRNYGHNTLPLNNSFNDEHAEKGEQPAHGHLLPHSVSCDALPTESSNGRYMSLTPATRNEVSSDYETLRPRNIIL